MISTAVGVLCILGIGIFLYRHQLLTRGGMAAGITIGSAISIRLGSLWLALIAGLFYLALAVTRLHSSRKSEIKPKFSRDAIDLLPVGGVVTAASLQPHADIGRFVALAAMAFALADILASELGPLTSSSAFSIYPFRRVSHGVPGAVSLGGLGFSLVGSALPSLVAWVWRGLPLALIVFLSGLLGSVIDTGLSITWRPQLARRNDFINGVSVVATAAVALSLYWTLHIGGLR